MADGTIVHIGENSPEEVAYKLLRTIASNEGKILGLGASKATADRTWLLTTYAQCIRTVTTGKYDPKYGQ